MNPFLKEAHDAGRKQAEDDVKKELDEALKKRLEHQVGWREAPKTPLKLNDPTK
jgi:hypothetical protein